MTYERSNTFKRVMWIAVSAAITAAVGASGRGTEAVLLPVRTEPDAVAAPVPSDGYVEIILAAGTIRLHGRVAAEMVRVAIDGLSRLS
jgi:hypothetical protein